jgi:hypothetical protein
MKLRKRGARERFEVIEKLAPITGKDRKQDAMAVIIQKNVYRLLAEEALELLESLGCVHPHRHCDLDAPCTCAHTKWLEGE